MRGPSDLPKVTQLGGVKVEPVFHSQHPCSVLLPSASRMSTSSGHVVEVAVYVVREMS